MSGIGSREWHRAADLLIHEIGHGTTGPERGLPWCPGCLNEFWLDDGALYCPACDERIGRRQRLARRARFVIGLLVVAAIAWGVAR